jgi:hypothetical protein
VVGDGVVEVKRRIIGGGVAVSFKYSLDKDDSFLTYLRYIYQRICCYARSKTKADIIRMYN